MRIESRFTEDEISRLVDHFYAKVREDASLGPVFNEAVKNWDAHLALLKDFWTTVLMTSGRYKGNPMLAHFRLPIEERHFGRWLQLFSETACEEMSAGHAEVVMRKAELIAMNMRRVLAGRIDVPASVESSRDALDSAGSVLVAPMVAVPR
jgi:hemoglobin